MIASLMMYQRPELEGAHLRLWAAIRANLADEGIDAPEALSQDAPEFDVWLSPDLVLSQTCGMPYRLWLKDRVALVGTPDYGLEGCPPGYYRSPFVVRAEDPRSTLAEFRDAVFAYNQVFSQSGYAAPYAEAAKAGFWFENRVQSHGHLWSAEMVAQGKADIASLDAVSWRLMQRYEDFAAGLRVLTWTDPTPGLPLITATSKDATAVFRAVDAALRQLDEPDRDSLGIKGLVHIDPATYLSVPNPPDEDYSALPE